MALTLTQWNDLAYGHNSTSGYPDTMNKAAKQFWNDLFLTDHDRTGEHKADLLAVGWDLDHGTYAGDGLDNRNIIISKATLDIKFIRIWSELVNQTFFSWEGSTDQTKGTNDTAGFLTDRIQSVGTGTFQIGTSIEVNNNLTVYYYVVYGIS